MSEDIEFARAQIVRIVRESLPSMYSISTDTQLALNKSSTTFVKYLAMAASDIAKERKHGTVTPGDVKDALALLDFDQFNSTLNTLLADIEREKALKRERKKENEQKKKLKLDEGKGKVNANFNVNSVVIE